MSVRTARRIFVAYIIAMAVLLTWPGIQPFNAIRPMIFGLPFIVVWVAFWVAAGSVVLVIMDRAVTRDEKQSRPGD